MKIGVTRGIDDTFYVLSKTMRSFEFLMTTETK